ncbi:MAG TPA: tRNA pseudouridine(38-40) synthase TruA [Jatrophihabitantaceae bacterium]|jgi:tRNA pseudouridine38-40 synthase|nr:tRNA pseudouridine(38-40) synthase TruA [Jatrophihabitantaceae bacterium]
MNEPVIPAGGGGLVRIRLDIAYDGCDFVGWARQPGQRAVQTVLENALATVFRLPSVRLTVAGRTDAGVHARGQVAHADVDAAAFDAQERTLLRRLAGLLPPDVRVREIRRESPDFDARFSALWRHYEYRVTDASWGTEPLRRFDTLAWPKDLDAVAMASAARGLLGEHNFVAFCRRRDGATTIRGLTGLDVARTGALIIFEVRADAFCHSMVRSIVGALLAVGDGRRPVNWPASLLSRAARADEVSVAPAHGLTLIEVGYPARDGFAARSVVTRSRRD